MDNSLLESIVNKIDKNICRSFNDNQLYLYQTRDDYFSSIYFKLVKELKSIYNLANRTISTTPIFKPNNVPSNTSMNLNKLYNKIKYKI